MGAGQLHISVSGTGAIVAPLWIPAYAGVTTTQHFPRSPSQAQRPPAFSANLSVLSVSAVRR